MVATKSPRSSKPLSSLELALDHLERHPDTYVFPIKAGKKTPPLISDNLRKASNDPAQIKAWHDRWPGCNWGLALKKSRLVVADIDMKAGKVGRETFVALSKKHGPWPKCYAVMTPSGGVHRYYAGEHVFALGKAGFGADIDSPHYVLIAGCKLDGAGHYSPVKNGHENIPPAPKWFRDYLKEKPKAAKSDTVTPVVEQDTPAVRDWCIHHLNHDAPHAIEGEGGEATTLKVAMTLRDHGASQDLCLELMSEHYNVSGICDPLWEIDGDNGLARKIENAYQYANLRAPGASTAWADFVDDPYVGEIPPLTNGKKAPALANANLIFIDAHLVKPEPIEFIWPGRLARGKYTSFAGMGGLGKSHLMYSVAAIISMGGAWPDGGKALKGKVILMSAEDGMKDVMVPRLIAAGADMTQIKILEAVTNDKGGVRKFDLTQDMARLEQAVKQIGNVLLIGIDPISSYLGGDIDSHKDSELRHALDPVNKMAEATGAAVLSIAHFNKSGGCQAALRVMGSAAFVNTPRVVCGVFENTGKTGDAMDDLNQEGGRYLLHIKNDLGKPPVGLKWHIDHAEVTRRRRSVIPTSRVVWDGKTDVTANEVSRSEDINPHRRAKLSDADFLREQLGPGPIAATELQEAAQPTASLTRRSSVPNDRSASCTGRRRAKLMVAAVGLRAGRRQMTDILSEARRRDLNRMSPELREAILKSGTQGTDLFPFSSGCHRSLVRLRRKTGRERMTTRREIENLIRRKADEAGVRRALRIRRQTSARDLRQWSRHAAHVVFGHAFERQRHSLGRAQHRRGTGRDGSAGARDRPGDRAAGCPGARTAMVA